MSNGERAATKRAVSFLVNVNSREFTLAICYRPSVCRLSVCRLVCMPVTLLRPTQPVEIFSNVSSPFGTLATR